MGPYAGLGLLSREFVAAIRCALGAATLSLNI